ncbi:MAG: hypothetical protein MJZ06_05005 [Bacteroidaceae bacterium]|nr:hypothetical protein [Bacteroidaceae bacterium]
MRKISFILIVALMMPRGMRAQTNEFSIEYGRGSLPAIAYTMGSIFAVAFGFGLLQIEDSYSLGCVTAGYWHYFDERFSVGGDISTEIYRMNFNVYDGKDEEGKSKYRPSDWKRMEFCSLMPGVRYKWVSRPHFGMYSKLCAGATLYHQHDISVQTDETETEELESDTDFSFAMQFSPLGIEAGNESVRGFTEIGFGMEGIILAGVRYIF